MKPIARHFSGFRVWEFFLRETLLLEIESAIGEPCFRPSISPVNLKAERQAISEEIATAIARVVGGVH
jgi:hypothetical protein